MGKGRAPCCDKTKVKRGAWSAAEDLALTAFIQTHGHTNWRALPKQAGLLRCGKSCRLRWINYLRPDLKRGSFTPQEEQTIINLHNSIGNKWSKIASYFPGRTDNEIKNVWNTHLKKRVSKKSNQEDSTLNQSTSPSSVSTDHNTENIVSQEPTTSDSPESSYASNTEDGKIEIPMDPDMDLWEVLDWLDDENGRESDNGNNNWLRLLENELGLSGDVDNLTKEEVAIGDMNSEQEIGIGLDYFPTWPSSPLNIDI